MMVLMPVHCWKKVLAAARTSWGRYFRDRMVLQGFSICTKECKVANPLLTAAQVLQNTMVDCRLTCAEQLQIMAWATSNLKMPCAAGRPFIPSKAMTQSTAVVKHGTLMLQLMVEQPTSQEAGWTSPVLYSSAAWSSSAPGLL